jgi:hypothetical protein
MASGFFALFDDIATLMDDVATMSKVAAKKTAGILGDDLAVNADQASGFVSARELPILWKISKGSILNKLIILPLAFLLSAFLPQAIKYILLTGAVYLAYEGAEKVIEYIFHRKNKSQTISNKEIILSTKEIQEIENKKIKGAILVDFILSIEIIVIALSTVVNEPLITQIVVVTGIALLATIGVYGIVALLVRMDDFGLRLLTKNKRKSKFINAIGHALINSLPYIIRVLAVVGTLAMLLVAGGIFSHNIHFFHNLIPSMPQIINDFILGLIIGIITVLLIKGCKSIKKLVT